MLQLTLANSRNHFITVEVNISSPQVKTLFTGIYGEPYSAKRHQFLARFYFVHNDINISWVVFGDLNQIFDIEDKYGGSDPNCFQMAFVKSIVCSINLYDMGFRGQSYTWKTGDLYMIRQGPLYP